MPLNPMIRLDQPDAEDEPVDDMEEIGDGGSEPLLEIEHDDGSITISLNGRTLGDKPEKKANGGWFGNLAEDIDDSEMNRIADELLRGIEDDLESRRDWVESRANGIKLLGLQLELPGLQGASEGASVEGMSKVRHPLLQEAVLRFQANARSEMLPTDGPVKLRDDGNRSTVQRDELENAFQKDLNHYLTSTAKEYYPDTDRMFLLLGFGGTTFKKVYYDPLKQRPVSLTVDADDLIVNNAATDLASAQRVTHRIMMKPSTVKRMQIIGAYMDVELSDPLAQQMDAVQEQKKAQQGVTESGMRPQDRSREIYEVYCELDIVGFEHEMNGKETGLEIPYRVTIDVSDRKILSIVRNFNEDTADLPEARSVFVKYIFVPGFGFYDIGLLNILGNTTNAVTAAWRELLDAGMFANFPGFMLADTGGRQNTNIFRIPPGGSALVKTGGMKIGDAIMPLPYKEPSQALMGLVDNMAQTGMRVGGTSEQAVGEGRADAPVGTTLALIEQAVKVLNSVHKRMHQAQSEELALLIECFREHPESFWQRNKKPALSWDQETFLRALDMVDVVPQADPNTSSYAQRVMKIMALKQLQTASPNLYDPVAVDTAALRAIGWSNPEQFLKPQDQQQQLPPEIQKGIAEIKISQQEADAKTLTARATMLKAQQVAPQAAPQQVDPIKAKELQLKEAEIASSVQRDHLNDINRDKDREMDERLENQRMDIEHMKFAQKQEELNAGLQHERAMQGHDHSHDHLMTALQIAAQVEAAKHKVKAK